MIDRDVLNLHTFCAKSEILNAKYLNYICITEEESVASDGNCMGIVENPSVPGNEYPNPGQKEIVTHGFLHANKAKNYKILKAEKGLQRFENILMLKGEKEGSVGFYNTNSEESQMIEEDCRGLEYPDFSENFPGGAVKGTITLDVKYLKTIVDYINKFDCELGVVDISVYKKNDPVKFECKKSGSERKFTALIMPIVKR